MDPYSPSPCQKQKECYVKADIPSYRTPAQRCNTSAYTRRCYTYKPPPLFMRSWQETLWNTICSIYWSSYKSLSFLKNYRCLLRNTPNQNTISFKALPLYIISFWRIPFCICITRMWMWEILPPQPPPSAFLLPNAILGIFKAKIITNIKW